MSQFLSHLDELFWYIFILTLYLYLGYFDLAVESDWRWIDCSRPNAWALGNWGEGQPDDLNGAQECGQILQDGKFHDWECDRAVRYICEINVFGKLYFILIGKSCLNYILLTPLILCSHLRDVTNTHRFGRMASERHHKSNWSSTCSACCPH